MVKYCIIVVCNEMGEGNNKFMLLSIIFLQLILLFAWWQLNERTVIEHLHRLF